MNKLIGIIGLKRSGKDTTADYLCKKHGFIKYSFANPLKKGCMEMFGFTYDQVFGDAKDEIHPVWNCTPRDILKIMGTEVCQYDLQKYVPSFNEIGRLIWVKRFEQWYAQVSPTDNDFKVVIPDVRFVHEAESIVKMGGEIWRVDRPGMDVGDLHASEKEMFNIQYIKLLTNDKDLNYLYSQIDGK
jgi:hypothetical protein